MPKKSGKSAKNTNKSKSRKCRYCKGSGRVMGTPRSDFDTSPCGWCHGTGIAGR